MAVVIVPDCIDISSHRFSFSFPNNAEDIVDPSDMFVDYASIPNLLLTDIHENDQTGENQPRPGPGKFRPPKSHRRHRHQLQTYKSAASNGPQVPRLGLSPPMTSPVHPIYQAVKMPSIRTPPANRPIQQPRRDTRPACSRQRASPAHVCRAQRNANHPWLTHH